MDIELAYGRQGLVISLPDSLDVTVLAPRFELGLADPRRALQAALRAPDLGPRLSDAVKAGDRVGIVFSDITRPAPHQMILPALLAEMATIPHGEIILFNALGTHRPNTDAELRAMLGAEIVERYRIVQNDAFDADSQIRVGAARRGHDIWLNREFAQCDLKILTGFIEPHFFAGFSGGGKAIMPGMAGLRTILQNHDATMVGNPGSTWGVTWGNPIWAEVREVAIASGRSYLVNVAMNKLREITGVFAGSLDLAHQAGCEFVKRTAMVAVDEPFDVVIATNSGYPLDMNLYQTVKGMSAAAQVVRPGGTIIMASECSEGIPEHGLYRQLLAGATDPAELLGRVTAPGFLAQDQWQAQIQAQIQAKATVHLYSDHLTPEQIRAALLVPCTDIAATAMEQVARVGGGCRIAVLPEGPQTVPYLRRA